MVVERAAAAGSRQHLDDVDDALRLFLRLAALFEQLLVVLMERERKRKEEEEKERRKPRRR